MSFVVRKKHMSGEVGFYRKVLSVFERFNISIEHTPTGMDMFGITVADKQVAKHSHTIIGEIENTLGATVTIERDISLIAVVGRNMVGHYGICAAIFKILCENQINVKMITQSPDELNIIVGIDGTNHAKAIRALYDGLCKEALL
jgi:aspartate kinase